MQCKDFEVCGNEHDDEFTMDFTDVKPGAFIYWCSECGLTARLLEEELMEKLKDPTFKDKLETALAEYNQ